MNFKNLEARGMKKRALWIGGIVVTAAAVAGIMAMRGGGEEMLHVETARVERRQIIQRVSATGKIQPRIQVKVSADVSAKITKLAVVEGQWVEEGTFLAELDRERYLAAVESAEAQVRSAKANASLVKQNLIRTEKDYTRSRELTKLGINSDAEFEVTEAAYQVEVARSESAVSQVEQAMALLKQARDDLSKTTIYAPMSGTISDLNKEQGEIAIGSQFQEDVILVIADLSEMEAQVDVDENDIVAIAIGQSAEIEVDALLDQVLTGTVQEIASSANDLAGGGSRKIEFEIKIAIDDPPATLRPGMTAGTEVATHRNDAALSVPIQSVAVRTLEQLVQAGESLEEIKERYEADRDGFVEVVFCIEDGVAVARQVETGIQSDEYIEILSGVEEGEMIVTGSYRAISKELENGMAVEVEADNQNDDSV
jgi:HlyD family secretion protein